MPLNRHVFLLVTLCCLPSLAAEHTVHRCENSAGHITFTTLSCRPEENLSLQRIHPYEERCGNLLTAGQRRDAIMDRRIVTGMSQQDVESALGKPDSIKIRNSSTRYTYKEKNGRSAEVVFDEKGCVKGKSQATKSPR